jgi:hypothetical protein
LVADGERRQVVRAISFYDQHEFCPSCGELARELFAAAQRYPTMVLAHAYAELGREECLKLLDEAMDRCPAECGALRAVYFKPRR